MRFIPTHVGNTTSDLLTQRGNAVHPHACGEHVASPVNCRFGTGSSPRMWGTHQTSQCYIPEIRFIPTHVGNTTWLLGKTTISAVHPHACGEHTRQTTIDYTCNGSSPRMWGTLYFVSRGLLTDRFIPTHVGNTTFGAPPRGEKEVHPHACGEHIPSGITALSSNGSSPRMWGTLLRCES